VIHQEAELGTKSDVCDCLILGFYHENGIVIISLTKSFYLSATCMLSFFAVGDKISM